MNAATDRHQDVEPRLRLGAYLPDSWGVYCAYEWAETDLATGQKRHGYHLRAEFSEFTCLVYPGQVQAALDAARDRGR